MEHSCVKRRCHVRVEQLRYVLRVTDFDEWPGSDVMPEDAAVDHSEAVNQLDEIISNHRWWLGGEWKGVQQLMELRAAWLRLAAAWVEHHAAQEVNNTHLMTSTERLARRLQRLINAEEDTAAVELRRDVNRLCAKPRKS